MNDYQSNTLPIDTSTSGDNPLVSGVVGQRIVVTGYTLIARSPVDVRWKSDSNNKSGLLPLLASVGASPAYNPRGAIICGVGEDLVLNLSDAIYVGGHFTFEMRE